MIKFGLSSEMITYLEAVLTKSLSTKSKYRVEVFGSRARGDFRKYSDLDLWIEASPPLTVNELQQLREQFENSDLAIGIDIVTPENVLSDYLEKIKSEIKPWLQKQA